MIDHHTQQRKEWLRELQPRPIVADITAAALGALAFLAALFII